MNNCKQGKRDKHTNKHLHCERRQAVQIEHRFVSSLAWFLECFTVFAVASVILTGCMVGPDFYSPKSPITHSYTGTKFVKGTTRIPAASRAGVSQQFILHKQIPAMWWSLFHSKILNDLIQEGLSKNATLAESKAALSQAKEILTATTGMALWPMLSTTASTERIRFAPATIGSIQGPSLFSIYSAAVNVAYTLDWLGGGRRLVEASQAQVDVQKFELEGAYLSLCANISTEAITIARLQSQIQATHGIIQAAEKQYRLTSQQFRLGKSAKTDVLLQLNQLASFRASLPPLEQSLLKNLHALSVLLGRVPDEKLPIIDLDKLVLPSRLPIILPSVLVRQRPDIQVAEALLHAASAQIGVAIANLYPQITLDASYGWSSLSTAHFFNAANNTWNIIGQLLQPVWNHGALQAKKRAAIAAFEQAFAHYRQTVLTAFQQVADVLRALQEDAKLLKAQIQAEHAARATLFITQKQFDLGAVDYLVLLLAQRQYQLSKMNRIEAQASRYMDTVALFQALGGVAISPA